MLRGSESNVAEKSAYHFAVPNFVRNFLTSAFVTT